MDEEELSKFDINLFEEIYNKNLPHIEKAIEEGTDVKSRDIFSRNLLHVVAMLELNGGEDDILFQNNLVKLLLQKGVDPD